jgi:hypothetical protein
LSTGGGNAVASALADRRHSPVDIDTTGGSMTIVAEYVKVSISMPGDLIESLKERAGPGGVSAYVTEAVQLQLQMEWLDEVITEMEAEHGPADMQKVRELEEKYFS